MVASYAFILQPYYEPLKDEVVTDEKAIDTGMLSGYIIKNADGSYSFVNDDNTITPIFKETADALASLGYKIQEES